MVDFNALLSKRADEVERPKNIPIGTWEYIVQSNKFDVSAQKKTPYVEFTYGLLAPGEDVDPTDLESYDYQGKVFREKFYLTEASLFRLTDWLATIGLTDGTLNELVEQATGQSGKVSIGQRAGDPNPVTGEVPVYSEVKGWAAA